MDEMRLAVMGAAGRMGKTLVKAVKEANGVKLTGAIERRGDLAIGEDAGLLAGVGKLLVNVSDDPLEVIKDVDGILDFTAPSASVEFAALAAQARIVHVIGSTGFSPEQEAKIAAAARHATIIKSGNMSLGVNLLLAVVKKIASSLGDDYDIEVLEMHHNKKVDAPSGTALMLGRAAAEGRAVDLAGHAVRSRDGHTGARKRGEIGFATLRGGSVVGEHTVIFAGDDERIEVTHRANDRSMFARGAVHAAMWGRGRKPGVYSMADVLDL